MPAVSKSQQRFMGMVYAFASTKHKKLPEKKTFKEFMGDL